MVAQVIIRSSVCSVSNQGRVLPLMNQVPHGFLDLFKLVVIPHVFALANLLFNDNPCILCNQFVRQLTGKPSCQCDQFSNVSKFPTSPRRSAIGCISHLACFLPSQHAARSSPIMFKVSQSACRARYCRAEALTWARWTPLRTSPMSRNLVYTPALRFCWVTLDRAQKLCRAVHGITWLAHALQLSNNAIAL